MKEAKNKVKSSNKKSILIMTYMLLDMLMF